tara:strand:+ start:215 stop:451 length:237 start_codon:yes stop_codon:yes gene_type:complete
MKNLGHGTITFNDNELDMLNNFASGLLKDLVRINSKLEEVDECLKYHNHIGYKLTRRSLLEDKETILGLISKIKEVAN